MPRIGLFLSIALPVAALAAPLSPQEVGNRALIESSGIGYQGNLSVNQAAGEKMQQINSRALAIGGDAGAATRNRQRQELGEVDPALDAQSVIRGDAFAKGSGVLGVNQSSGGETQQINAFSLSITSRPQSLDDSILAEQSVMPGKNSGAAESAPGTRMVDVDDRAFAGSSGVVQLNQSAGVGNRMANTVSIRVMD